MLDHYLALEEKTAAIADRDAVVDALYMQLPVEDLRHIANGGEVKLAYGSPVCSDGSSGPTSWLDGFRGSPLFSRAIALEEQELKHNAESMQRNAVEDQTRQEGYRMGEQIRLQKRLLEIEKAKAEMGAQSASPPDAPAQGAGAMGDVPSQGIGKMAMSSGVAQQIQTAAPHAVKLQMKPSSAKLTANQIARTMPPPAPTAARVSSLGTEPDPFAKTAEVVDGWGRELARNDVARGEQASMLGAAAGEAAKIAAAADFLGTAMKGVGAFAKAHPGAAIGGGLGALHGLLHQGGGLGSAVLEGAGGAALGHGAQHLGGAAMAANPELAGQVRSGADRLKAAIGGMVGRATGPDPTKLASKYNALKGHAAMAGMGAAYGGLTSAVRGGIKENELKRDAAKHPDSKVRKFIADHPRSVMGAAGAATGAGITLGVFGNKKALGKDLMQLKIDAKKYLNRGKERDAVVNKAMDIMKTKKAEAEKEAAHDIEKVRKVLQHASPERLRSFGSKMRMKAMDMHEASGELRHGKHKDWPDFLSRSERASKVSDRASEVGRFGRLADKEESRRAVHTAHHQGAAVGAVVGAGVGAGGLKLHQKAKEKQKEAGLMASALGGAARMGMNAMTKMPAVAAGNVAGAGGMAGLAGKAMGWMKGNPMKAIGAGMNAASNFASARQSGQGVGSSLLSGAAGGATSLG